MLPPPVPLEVQDWALAQFTPSLDNQQAKLVPLVGDASSRRYFRLDAPGESYIVAHAPPATEKNEAFVAIRELMADAGIKVPEIFAVDLPRGFLLLEDLGDRLLLPELTTASVGSHYDRARDILLRMATVPQDGTLLPLYDHGLLSEELERFPQWFAHELLGYKLTPSDRECLDNLWDRLIGSALEQPRVLVHRDFHSRNLMLQGSGELAVIDFQDAVLGPVTYDLVSLLKDCYIPWPYEKVHDWALLHRDALQAAGYIAPTDDERFLRWFDWMGLQRHIKVLGTFARLYLRDGKATYLQDLPLVIRYVREVAAKHAPREPAFAAFSDWFDTALAPLIASQAWSAPR